ncbi:NmrA family NAD(P)-binding protein [Neolewinella persica]|uniref:NmrA family NAD(P)-binding protein n=1 Tax=Neolewinella persica TaxID=70998 RepID=UPI00036070A7|nr:NmrA family NAD(P)-binding protein [Neolewinella persica]
MEEKNVLITGATGTIGKSVIHHLLRRRQITAVQIIAAVRSLSEGQQELQSASGDLEFRHFDFLDVSTYDGALANIHTMFLLRPPQITDISGVFRPLIKRAVALGVRKIVFLSVQGAERSSIIPHNKIERVVKEQGIPYIFLRPGYFMQNLTGELLEGIKSHNEIFLPGGNACFNWVDAENVSEVAAVLLSDLENEKNLVLEITGSEQLAFDQVATLLTRTLGRKITYRKASVLGFLTQRIRSGVPPSKAVVVTALHYLRRFEKSSGLSSVYKEVAGKRPTTLAAFLHHEREAFT